MTSQPGLAQQQALRLSRSAVARLRELYARQPVDKRFRVYITGGGCAGFQYGFRFDDEQLDEDLEICQDDVSLVVDSLSLQYLHGSEIDFSEDLMGAKFLVHNPQSSTTCSCGSSFSI